VKLGVFSPYTCNGNPILIDSAELFIYDSILVQVITPDTAVCKYQTVDLQAVGDTLLTYLWTPSAGLSDPNIPNPSATSTSTTTYTVAATIAGSGCPPAHDQVTITIKQEPGVDAGPDRTTCLGTPVQFNLNVTPTNQTYSYVWSPGTYLNSATIANPISNPTADITYYIKVDPGAVGCYGYDTVNVHVLPNDFSLFNHDTSICKGASVVINALGDPAFTYNWTPAMWVSDPALINPVITPDTSVQYTLTATFPNCPNIVKNLYIDVQPNPQVNVGPDREKCQWDTLELRPGISPDTYPFYTYTWTPGGGVDNPTKNDVIFSGQLSVKPLTLTVKTPAGCTGSDALDITVHAGNFGKLAPADTGICPRETVELVASGGVFYDWTPGLFLDDSTAATTTSRPVTDIDYSLLITDQFGCFDTLTSHIVVHPEASLDLGRDVTLYPGESFQPDPQGNTLYYQWFPPLGLSAANIANPIVMPDVSTRYFVTGTTEWGCSVQDSIDVTVNPETVIDIPNAFSPGSGPNSELKIIKRGIATLKYFRIFNRWGAQVFSTDDIDKGWDGTLGGTPQPMGVYVYMVEAYTKSGKRFYKQGNITLIR